MCICVSSFIGYIVLELYVMTGDLSINEFPVENRNTVDMQCVFLPLLWLIAIVSNVIANRSLRKEKAFKSAVRIILTVCINHLLFSLFNWKQTIVAFAILSSAY